MDDPFPQSQLPAVAPPTKRRLIWRIAFYTVLTALGFGIGASTNGNPSSVGAPGPTVTRTVKPAVAAPSKPSVTVSVTATVKPKSAFGDGSWLVGRDIKAGTYTTIEEVAGSCYWERHNVKVAGIGGIIANDNVTGGHPTVSLKSGEEFRTRECGDWRAA